MQQELSVVLGELPDHAVEGIKSVLADIVPLDGHSLEAFRAEFLQRNGHRGDCVLAGAESLLLIRGQQDASSVYAQWAARNHGTKALSETKRTPMLQSSSSVLASPVGNLGKQLTHTILNVQRNVHGH